MNDRDGAGGADREAEELAKRLCETDFSAASGVRESLRARLLAEAARRRAAPPGWARAAVLAPAAAFAAVVLGLYAAGPDAPAPEPPPSPGCDRILVLAPKVGGTALSLQAVLPESPERPDVALGRVEAFDGETSAAVLSTVEGRVTESETSRVVRWETGGRVFVLETRVVALEDIFATQSMGTDYRRL